MELDFIFFFYCSTTQRKAVPRICLYFMLCKALTDQDRS